MVEEVASKQEFEGTEGMRQSGVQFAGCGVEPLQTYHGHPPWVEVELLAPSRCVARCIERSGKGASASEAEGFRGVISQLSLKGKARSCQALRRRFGSLLGGR